MPERQVNVLVIAPYEGLKEEILREGQAFPGLRLDVRVGNL